MLEFGRRDQRKVAGNFCVRESRMENRQPYIVIVTTDSTYMPFKKMLSYVHIYIPLFLGNLLKQGV